MLCSPLQEVYYVWIGNYRYNVIITFTQVRVLVQYCFCGNDITIPESKQFKKPYNYDRLK